MGEVRTRGARNEIDQNTRLRPTYFSEDDLLRKYKDLPLGIAVAASTAVPGVFHAQSLTDLYAGWTPQLVDGGVHDNQGIEGLLDNKCTHRIVSDACGQMEDDPDPSTRMISVLSRSNSVMMDRIREEMYETAALRRDTEVQVQELDFLHLRQDLEQPELTRIGREPENLEKQQVGRTISYGVDKNIQIFLSSVRTDLDSCSEVEAQALMADGYLIAKSQIKSSLARKPDPSCPLEPEGDSTKWGFCSVMSHLEDPNQDPLFCRQLEISSAIAFKVFKRFRWLRCMAVGLGMLLAVTLFWRMVFVDPNNSVGFADEIYERLHTYRALGLTAFILVLYGLLFLVPRRVRWVAMLRNLPRQLALRAGAATIAATAAWLHILVFDWLFLWQGRVARLREISPDELDSG